MTLRLSPNLKGKKFADIFLKINAKMEICASSGIQKSRSEPNKCSNAHVEKIARSPDFTDYSERYSRSSEEMILISSIFKTLFYNIITLLNYGNMQNEFKP